MRKAAVAAATKKAELYAEEAGAALSPIVHIEDVDPERLRGERTRNSTAVGTRLSVGHAAAGQGRGLPCGEVDVLSYKLVSMTTLP